jgi:hypothetical protein
MHEGHTYIHTYIHTHIHTHIHTYTHTYIHIGPRAPSSAAYDPRTDPTRIKFVFLEEKKEKDVKVGCLCVRAFVCACV